ACKGRRCRAASCRTDACARPSRNESGRRPARSRYRGSGRGGWQRPDYSSASLVMNAPSSRDCNTPLGGAIEPKNAPPQFRVKPLKLLGRKVPKTPAFDALANQQSCQLRLGQRDKFRAILIARRRPRIRPGGGMSINLREAVGQIFQQASETGGGHGARPGQTEDLVRRGDARFAEPGLQRAREGRGQR